MVRYNYADRSLARRHSGLVTRGRSGDHSEHITEYLTSPMFNSLHKQSKHGIRHISLVSRVPAERRHSNSGIASSCKVL